MKNPRVRPPSRRAIRQAIRTDIRKNMIDLAKSFMFVCSLQQDSMSKKEYSRIHHYFLIELGRLARRYNFKLSDFLTPEMQ